MSAERIIRNDVAEIAESVRELVDVLDALHEMHSTLPKRELELFINLRDAIRIYDRERND